VTAPGGTRYLATLALGLALAVGMGLAASPAAGQERHHPFQQGVSYRIEATLDEATAVLHGRARLRYENRAPGAVTRLYFHQYLNAFRPNSAWARYDLRFGDRTFQDLGPEEHGFERIAALAVDGRPVPPVYPHAPDSTVFYIELPRPLDPGQALVADLEWTARLATEPRRQGREGRHHNWAHWYPRIAVFGQDGWEYRPHIRPGEFNGSFAAYDVTLELAMDQVMGATGVPVEGDPGWAAAGGGVDPLYRRDHYGTVSPEGLALLAEPGGDRKQVRWRAEEVHHFAWSTSPDYRYRGGLWNDVPIHLLWEPASPGWDADRVLRQQRQALDWLVELVGEYAWPQITVTDRVEPGATEFPMMYMTSGGAVVHETVHMIVPGILATNEWREAWLDEGLATFLSYWFREARGEDPEQVWGRVRETVARLDAVGYSEPVGLPAAHFSSFETYQVMTYYKGAILFRMLRDMLGEEVFRRGLRRWYDDFRFRQVTGADFRRAMEAASDQDLGWFFEQWLDSTRFLDYRVEDVRLSGAPGAFTLTARVVREAEAWMPVVVEAGGQRQRLESRDRVQTVTFRLREPPAEITLDPDGSLPLVHRDRASAPVR
jgi:hypothetical protein